MQPAARLQSWSSNKKSRGKRASTDCWNFIELLWYVCCCCCEGNAPLCCSSFVRLWWLITAGMISNWTLENNLLHGLPPDHSPSPTPGWSCVCLSLSSSQHHSILINTTYVTSSCRHNTLLLSQLTTLNKDSLHMTSSFIKNKWCPASSSSKNAYGGLAYKVILETSLQNVQQENGKWLGITKIHFYKSFLK